MCSACCCSTSSSWPACSRSAWRSSMSRARSGAGMPRPAVPWYDWLLAALSLVVGVYIAVRYPALSEEMTERPIDGLIVAFITVPLVIEGLRRTVGMALTIVVLVFLGLRAGRPPGARRARRPAGEAHPARLLSGLGYRQHARPAADGGDDHRHRLRVFRRLAVRLRRLGVLHRHRAHLDGPLPRRLGQDRGHRLLPVRHDLRQRGEQCRLRRRHHHSADAARRLSRPRRRRDRGGGLDRRPVDAAGDGRRRLPDGRIPAGALPDVAIAATLPALLYYYALFIQADLLAARSRAGADRGREIPPLRQVLSAGLALPAAVRDADLRAVLAQLVAGKCRRSPAAAC